MNKFNFSKIVLDALSKFSYLKIYLRIKILKNCTCSVYHPSYGCITGDSSPLYTKLMARHSSGESQVVYDNDWGYVSSSKPQTLRLYLNFYQYHSRTIQQAETK